MSGESIGNIYQFKLKEFDEFRRAVLSNGARTLFGTQSPVGEALDSLLFEECVFPAVSVSGPEQRTRFQGQYPTKTVSDSWTPEEAFNGSVRISASLTDGFFGFGKKAYVIVSTAGVLPPSIEETIAKTLASKQCVTELGIAPHIAPNSLPATVPPLYPAEGMKPDASSYVKFY